jgi:hypothetical protein
MMRTPALARGAAMLGLLLAVSTRASEPARAQRGTSPADRPPQAGSERVLRGPLAVRDASFVYRDGAPFRWRGITAFRLLEQVAHGHEQEARAFMDWARARGFNLVRVLGMARHLFPLTPGDGVKALPRLLRLAAEADLCVELVVFADSRDFPKLSFQQHVDAVAAAIGSAPNVVVELANENDHPTQDPKLTDLELLRSLRARLPRAVPVSLGSLHGPGPLTNRFPGGDYLTAHLYRGGDAWEQLGRIPGFARLARETRRPVVSDEPIGAGERVDPGRRLADPAVFFAMGLLGRMAGVGSTFHCEDCLQARVPGPTQTACAEAFVEGSLVVPDAEVASLVPGASGGGPLSVEQVPGGAGVYVASISSGRWHLVLALGLRPGAAIPWRHRWSATVVAERPGVRVFRARQQAAGGGRDAEGRLR